MTTNEQKQEDFNFTTAVRGTYVNIIVPKAFKKGGQEKGDPKYSTVFVCEPDNPDFVRLKTEVTAKLNANNVTGKKLKVGRLTEEQEKAQSHVEVQVPWKDGTKFADEQKAKGKDGEYARGKMLVKATSKYQPALSALENGKILEFTTPEAVATAKKFFYSGAFVVPGVGLHWYKGDQGKPDGVSLYFNACLFAKHGERIGGRTRNAAESFKGYLGAIKDEDPTGGAGVEDDNELDDL